MSENPETIPENIPRHVGIIMDGNGRWAAERGLPRLAGHRAGTENLRDIIRASVEFGIKYLTIYAFSTENWNRPRTEVQGLMHLLADAIEKEFAELNEQGVRIRHLGHMDGVPANLAKKIDAAVEATKNNDRLHLNVAFNYGGRDEVVRAIQAMIRDGLQPDEITEERINQYLYTKDIPDPDLIIRTSGELRTSNFLIWQAAYAEWYITPVYWPAFGKEELRKALLDYTGRERRFGKTSAQIQGS
ncbi:MAG: isoprenyl transferase [Anaerolineaceae bacterium]|jgi:undecaprenyl diphosphate synthase|nr:isoprenyl transferase [Anaerolineaceae bacterium]